MAAWKAVAVDAAQARAAKAYRSWTGAPPPLAAWQLSWDELQAVRELDLSNPVTPELMGLLASSRADDRAVVAQAPGLIRNSLLLRPGSARTWANLVEAKYLAGEPAASLEPALVIATRLGKSEPNVQRIVANYGLAIWDEVAPATRDAIAGAVAAGMRRNPLEILHIAERRGRLSVACRNIAGLIRQPDAKALRLCPSRETAR